MREKVKMLRKLRMLRIFRYVMVLTVFIAPLSVLTSLTIKPAESADGDSIEVAILSSDDVTEMTWVQDYLLPFTDLTVVDVIDAQYSTPSLATLQNYDSILVYNRFAFNDAVLLGNVLADYVDSGGGVVLATFVWYTSSRLGGRIMTDYTPFVYAGSTLYSRGHLGWYNTSHPIMSGVNSISGHYRDNVALTTGAELVAAWNDTYPFVAVKGAVAGITVYPSFSSALPQNDWTGDVDTLIHNALVWVTEPELGTIKVAFLPSFGSSTSSSLIYTDLKNKWFLYGSYKLEFIDVDQPVTYEKLNATDADVVLICNPARTLQYTQSEADAIQSFLEQNATGIFMSFRLFWSSYNNTMLAPLVGVNGSALDSTAVDQNNTYALYQPGHPIFTNMTDPWISGGYYETQNFTVPSWHDAILDGAQIVAETTDSKAAVITYQRFLWKGIWATAMPDYISGNELDKQFVYNALVWLALPARVVIDNAFVTDTRTDVSAQEHVGFHATWSHNGSSITGGIIYVNGTEHSLNTTGWISFPVTYDTVGKRTWTVTRANCSYTTAYNQTVANPEITWDKVQVTLSITDNHINVGNSANVVKTATYQSDGSSFTGTVTFNDTLSKNSVGKYWYTVASISDPTHGITKCDSNSVDCIFDKATITLSVSHNRTGVGSKAKITWTAVYQYPSVEDYDGFIELNDTLTKSDVGEYTYKVSRIGGDTYNITAFQSNTVKVIFTLDTDGDGMPDTWETKNGLNSLDAADASLDPDGDGMTNLDEYQGGTDPNVSDAVAFPWLILIVIAAVLIVIAIVAMFLWRRRK